MYKIMGDILGGGGEKGTLHQPSASFIYTDRNKILLKKEGREQRPCLECHSLPLPVQQATLACQSQRCLCPNMCHLPMSPNRC